MSKLVDKERLAKLAEGLYSKLHKEIADEVTRATGVEEGFETRIAANEADIARLDGAVDVEGSVKKQIKDAIDVVNQVADGLDDRVEVLEGAVADMKDPSKDGSLAKHIAEEAAARDAADTQIKADFAAADKTLGERIAVFEANGAQDVAAFKAAQATKDQAQDEAIAAKVAQTAYDTKVAELVAEDERIVELVSTEKGRAEAAEAELKERIDDLVGNAEGSIKDQIADAIAQEVLDRNAAILVETNRAKGVEEGLDGRLDVIEGEGEGSIKKAIADEVTRVDAKIGTDIAAEAKLREDADKVLDERIKVFEEGEGSVAAQIQAAVNVEKERAEGVEEGLQDAIDLINNETNGILAQAKTYADTEDAKIETRVKANEDALAIVNGGDTVEGSIAKAEKDAKDYADQQIAALVDSAPDAMNTLNELAKAIGDHQDVYDAYVEQHATAMATMKQELQAEIDADVKKVQDELDKQKDATQKGTLAKKIADEVTRATGQEAAIRQELANEKAALQKEIDDDVKVEKDRAEAKEQELEGRLKAVELYTDEVEAAIEAAVKPVKEDVDALEGRMDTAEGEIDALQAFVQGHSHEGLQGEIDAAEGRLDTLEAFVKAHDHTVIEQRIADNKAAIEAEVGKEGVQGNRDKAIAAALASYSDTEAVKGMLTNVINSLGLAIVENKLQLTLGTDDFVIKEVELDMATDTDIETILGGLGK